MHILFLELFLNLELSMSSCLTGNSVPDHPLTQPALHDSMRFLTKSSSFPMPHPPQMSNKGNYILSLSRFTAWLGGIAEEIGVEVYPGFGGAQVLYSEDKTAVQGVITNDVGLDL